MKDRTPTATVMALRDWRPAGQYIPYGWREHLRYDNGKPHRNAIDVLSDIVYWHRPKTIVDKETNQVIGYEKRFDADLLQRSYEQLSSIFGLSKRQCRDAVTFLENKGVITRVFRTIKTQSTILSNVLFIDLNVKKLFEISTPKAAIEAEKEAGLNHERHSYDIQTSHTLSRSNAIGVALESQTYTKTTTKNTKNPPTPQKVPESESIELGANAPGGISKSKKQNTLGIADQTLVANEISATAEKHPASKNGVAETPTVSLVDQTLTEFLRVTGWPMPTAKNRVLQYKKSIADHLDEKAFEGRLPDIYQAVWDQKREAVESGDLTLSAPGSFTNFMYNITNVEAPVREPSLNSLMNEGLVEIREDEQGTTLVWVETGEIYDF